jgi:hypothetical protein
VAVSVLSAVLVAAGLLYAAGTGERHKAALAAAGCEPNLSPSGEDCTTVAMLVGRYKTMTTPAAQQLTADAAAYAASEGHSLPRARAALTAEVTVEKALGGRLARFPFPPAVAPLAKALIQANDDCAQLTARQARSSSLRQARSFNSRVKVARAVVRSKLRLVRRALGSPPTTSQES